LISPHSAVLVAPPAVGLFRYRDTANGIRHRRPVGDETSTSAASEPTLGLMRWIALMGMPFALTYTIVIYLVFRGKVKLWKFSY
jgi:hypothetical protein